MSNARTCLTCGGPVPDDILDGLCPRCVARVSLASPSDEAPPVQEPPPSEPAGDQVASTTELINPATPDRQPGDRIGRDSLLVGVLAFEDELIDARQFIEVCRLWTTRKNVSLADLLVERGWIRPGDAAHLVYLVEGRLQRHGGDLRTALAAVSDRAKRLLAMVDDADIQRSLTDRPRPAGVPAVATVNRLPETPERYSLIRLHATGGIGRIWLARDHHLGRDIALKDLQPERADDAMLRARFLKEAQITGQLEHPGIVPVYELARRPEDQQPFYTMRLVRGRTLTEASRTFHARRAAAQLDSLELLALLNAFVAVSNTVAYAHSRGVIHRDLKGQNVVLGDFGEVVLLDWGLAKLVGRTGGEDLEPGVMLHLEATSEADQTAEGQALGTPAYMAPEQAAGRLDQIDRRTDVYGLGAMLYEILTGRPPFRGADTSEVLRKVQEEPPQPPRQIWAEVPPALEAACLRALAKNPADRYGAASELALEVQTWQEVQRRQAEDALRVSEALYHSLVETLPLSVWRKDLEGRFTFANTRFCESFHTTPAELVGKTDFDFFPVELAEKYRRDDARVHATGVPFATAEEHVTVEGKKLYVEVVKTPIRDLRGAIVGTQGIFWDVTDRKRLEQELEAAQAELARTRQQAKATSPLKGQEPHVQTF